VIDKETRYGLSLQIATALHEHRTDQGVGVHSVTDEWWCCVQAITTAVEEFMDEAVTETVSHDPTDWCELIPAKRQPDHGFIVDADDDPFPFPDDVVKQGLVEREGC
jgi:hypothetical protein